MATIKKVEGGKYEVRYDIINEQGQRVQKRKRFGKRKEADAFMASTRMDIDNNTYVEDKRLTLSDYFDSWLETHKASIEFTTYESYKSKIVHIKQYVGGVQLQKLSPVHIQGFYTKIAYEKGNISANSIIHIHRIFSKAMEDAYKMELIKDNPCRRVTLPKPEKHIAKFLEIHEVSKLLDGVNGSDVYTPTLLAVMLGLRRGEALGLRWSDVDFINGIINIKNTRTRISSLVEKDTKTALSARSLCAGDIIMTHLKNELKNQKELRLKFGDAYNQNDYVCKHFDGAPFDPGTFSHTFKNRIKHLNIPIVTFHELRHTNASLMLSAGIAPKIASQRLGHSDIGITMNLYSHVLKDANKDVANKLDLILTQK